MGKLRNGEEGGCPAKSPRDNVKPRVASDTKDVAMGPGWEIMHIQPTLLRQTVLPLSRYKLPITRRTVEANITSQFDF